MAATIPPLQCPNCEQKRYVAELGQSTTNTMSLSPLLLLTVPDAIMPLDEHGLLKSELTTEWPPG